VKILIEASMSYAQSSNDLCWIIIILGRVLSKKAKLFHLAGLCS